MIHRNFGEQPLEAGPAFGGPTAQAEVVINDDDALSGPAQERGVASEPILAIKRLAIFCDLLRGRLPDVDNRRFCQMGERDLARYGWLGGGTAGVSRRHRSPPSRLRERAVAGRGAC